jgi:hypothetical protein
MRITKAIPHKDIGFTTALNDLFMCMPGLSKCQMADASRIPMKLTQNCFTNLKWIYWNNSIASCTLPAFHRINIRVFQVTVSRYIPLLCVVFVQKVPMHSVLVNIPQVIISLQSRRPQHICPSCWTFSKLFHGPTNIVHVMSKRLSRTITLYLEIRLIDLFLKELPSSSVITIAHKFRIPVKLTGCTPLHLLN